MIKNKTISNLIISRDIRRMHMTKNIDSRLIEDKLIVNIRNSKNIKYQNCVVEYVGKQHYGYTGRRC